MKDKTQKDSSLWLQSIPEDILKQIYPYLKNRDLRALSSTSFFFNQNIKRFHQPYFFNLYKDYIGVKYGIPAKFNEQTDYRLLIEETKKRAKAGASILLKILFRENPLDLKNLSMRDEDTPLFTEALKRTMESLEAIKILAPENNLLPVIKELLDTRYKRENFDEAYFYYSPDPTPNHSLLRRCEVMNTTWLEAPINMLGISLLALIVLAGEQPCAAFLLDEGADINLSMRIAGTFKVVSLPELVEENITCESEKSKAMSWLLENGAIMPPSFKNT